MTIYSLERQASKKGKVQRLTKGSAMKINGEVASADRFPAGHYAEITLNGVGSIVEVFHNDCAGETEQAPTFKAPYFWVDPEHPERGAPLLMSLKPVPLGSYEQIISDPDHQASYTALLGVSQSAGGDTKVPDSLMMVRAIYWIKKRGGINAYDPKLIAKQAISAVSTAAANARKEYDRQMASVMDTLPKY